MESFVDKSNSNQIEKLEDKIHVCYEEVFSVRNPKDFPPKNKVDDEIFEDAYRDSDSLTAYDIELSDCKPVLVAIDCFKELQVYGELYGCIEDLVHYFDSDRDWRYDFN